MVMETNRYSKSKIYMIKDEESGKFYIGATTSTLKQRLLQHRMNSKEPHRKSKCYEHFKKINWKVSITLLEEHSLDSRAEMLREEDRVIKIHQNDPNCLNSIRAFLTEEERISRDLEYRKQYNRNTKEKRSENGKEYYRQNIDYITKKHKEYRDQNKEKEKEYRIKNKDRIREMNARLVTCKCGVSCTIYHLKRHEKSKFHINFFRDHNLINS